MIVCEGSADRVAANKRWLFRLGQPIRHGRSLVGVSIVAVP